MEDYDSALTAHIGEALGQHLTFTSRAEDGTLGGAIFVDDDDGIESVITRFMASPDMARMTGAAASSRR